MGGLGRSAFVGALAGVALFLLATLLEGGLRACVGDAIWDPAFDVVNAPAKLVSALWDSPLIAPQQKGWMCVSARSAAWSAEAFAAVGASVYAAIGGSLAALARFSLAGS